MATEGPPKVGVRQEVLPRVAANFCLRQSATRSNAGGGVTEAADLRSKPAERQVGVGTYPSYLRTTFAGRSGGGFNQRASS
jgi:hypothetical protein